VLQELMPLLAQRILLLTLKSDQRDNAGALTRPLSVTGTPKLTGRLRLSIDNLPYSSGPVRGTWADGRIQIVENCIGDFIVGLKVAAAAIKKSRLEREEWARRREEERKEREERERKAQERKRKAEFITELIGNWEKAERVRAFVKAMTECSAQLELSEKARRDIQKVADWTKEYAESLDRFPTFRIPLTSLSIPSANIPG
jgi:hypothetical protein